MSYSITRLCTFGSVCALVALTQPQSARATTLLVDIQAAGGVASTSTNFWANDNNVDLSAPVNFITSASAVTNLGPFAVSLTGGGGTFNTINGAANDDLPVLDGYWWTFGGVGSRTLTVTGLSSIPVGHSVTATFYGASDNDSVITLFNPTYGASNLGTQEAGGVPSARTTAFTFLSTGADQLSVPWGRKGDSGGAGFNGFSLTTVVPEPSTFALIGLGGLALLAVRRAAPRS